MEKFHLTQQIFKPNQIDELLEDFKFIKNNKKLEYANIPMSFDIETTSFYDCNNQKTAIMYAWVLGINGKTIIGRTWEEFILCLKIMQKRYQLNENKRCILYVHNLAFEFSFMQKLFNWINVFAVDNRKPVYAITEYGIEFRCSYILSNYSLDMVAKNLTTYKVEKLIGNLDYKKLRHNKTPLTDKELAYIQNDGLIVMAYIQELLDEYKNIHRLPLTATGFVRKYVRKECLYGGFSSHKHNSKVSKAYKQYSGLMSTLTIPSYKAYLQMKGCFQGGFTHCNSLYEGIVIDDVTSFDLTSAYPSVIVADMFPMSTPKLVKVNDIKEFKNYIKNYCCMFNITFYNIKPKLYHEHPISVSKCFGDKIGVLEDNGRVVEAIKISMQLTEIDFGIINDYYEYDKFDIWNMRIMEKGYLPTPFVKAVLKLYKDKTELKGLDDIDNLKRYLNSKGKLNACFGMAVTDIIQISNKFINGQWVQEEPNIKEIFDKYNNSKTRFLVYYWGLWITALNRKNLFLFITHLKDDYIYADTDSCKIRNADKHVDWINKYNDYIKHKLELACKHHKIDFSMVSPKTIKGVEKTLGFFDFDGHYKKFKTLGAKRYLVLDDNNEFHLTCAGVSKKAIDYMIEIAHGDIDEVFKLFDNNLYIPKGRTGKHIHTYIDDEREGIMTDYLGNKEYYHAYSGCHLEDADFTLSLSKKYIDYLLGLKEWVR